MISRLAIREFGKRPLRRLNLYKRLPVAELERRLALIVPEPRFHTVPRHNQVVGFVAGMQYEQLLYLYDMGTGKTKMILDLTRQRKRQGIVKRSLVLVPTVVGVDSWIQQAAEHAPMLRVVGLLGNTEERKAVLKSNATVIVMTYMGLLNLVCKPDRDKDAERWVINKPALRRLCQTFQMVTYDECTALKNHRSLTFRVARMMSKYIHIRYGLTGTPFGRDPQDLWGQFYAVDKGEALGPTLGIFRAAVFKEEENFWGGYIYTFKKKRAGDLRRMMAHSSIQYSADECGDLPPTSRVKRAIVWSDDTWDYYKRMVDELRAARGNYQIMDNLFVRMRQLASGLLVAESETGDRKTIRLANPKLDGMVEWISQLPESEKVVVFNEFIKSGDWITEALTSVGIKWARLYSKVRDKPGEVRRFNQDPDCRVFVVNTQSGAKVLNLQVARYIAFYESPVSPIDRQQAEKRCHREGQKRKVFFYDFYVKNSVEEKILEFLKEGKHLFDCLVRGKASL